MKAISLWQPWASAIAMGVKCIETRGWSTPYRGTLAIHAAQTKEGFATALLATPTQTAADRLELWYSMFGSVRGGLSAMFDDLPRGAIVATCQLAAVGPVEDPRLQSLLDLPRDAPRGRVRLRDLGDFSPGRFAWLLKDIVPLEKPWQCRGRQSLFDVPPKEMWR